MIPGRYRLRRAAGSYWLLDLAQEGKYSVRPLPLNESGGLIWRLLEEGRSEAEAAERLAQEYGIPCDEALSDISRFLCQLRKQGIEC